MIARIACSDIQHQKYSVPAVPRPQQGKRCSLKASNTQPKCALLQQLCESLVERLIENVI